MFKVRNFYLKKICLKQFHLRIVNTPLSIIFSTLDNFLCVDFFPIKSYIFWKHIESTIYMSDIYWYKQREWELEAKKGKFERFSLKSSIPPTVYIFSKRISPTHLWDIDRKKFATVFWNMLSFVGYAYFLSKKQEKTIKTLVN